MKPHPRIRKTIKWGGAVVTVLLVVVWIGSGWMTPSVEVLTPEPSWSISHGCVVRASKTRLFPSRPDLPWGNDFLADFTVEGTVQYRLLWLPSRSSVMNFDFLAIPLWPLIPLAAVPAGWIRYTEQRASRRIQRGRCAKCGYNRTGLQQGAKCPECGKLPT